MALVVVLPSTLNPAPIAAQDDERAYGEVWPYVILPVFPAGVRFWYRIEAPGETVESFSVRVEQNDALLDERDYDPFLDIMFGYEDAVEYEYFLDVQALPNFRMFDPLTVTAMATFADSTSYEDVITYIPEHQGYESWSGASAGDRLTIYLSDPDFAMDRVVPELLPTLDLLEEYLGPLSPVGLAAYTLPVSPFCEKVENEDGTIESLVLSERQNYPCSEAEMVDLYARSGLQIVTINNTGYSDVRDQLAADIVLQLYRQRWGDADIPEWFREGFGMYFAPNGHPEALPRAQQASQRNDLLSLRTLERVSNLDDQDLWNAQAFLLTLYLADLYGADAPQAIAGKLSPDKSFAEVLREDYDTTPERLYAAWEIWLDSSRAVEVAAYHPYLPTTPTPTPIPSITPTRTPTITPSPTLTPTQRPLFVPTNPPLATRGLPTFTPTATNTPLPPGFFDRVTPTVEPSNDNNDGNSQLCNTGIGALMFPLVALIIGRRRRVRRAH